MFPLVGLFVRGELASESSTVDEVLLGNGRLPVESGATVSITFPGEPEPVLFLESSKVILDDALKWRWVKEVAWLRQPSKKKRNAIDRIVPIFDCL